MFPERLLRGGLSCRAPLSQEDTLRAIRRSFTRSLSALLRTGTATVLLGGGGCSHAPSTPPPLVACEGFRGRTLEGALLTGASVIAAQGELPEYCQVTGTLPPSLHFEVRLPTAWNGRTIYGGGGGFDGFIIGGDSYTTQGYASIASDGGHTGHPLDGSFAQDKAALEDFASLSTHRVLPVAKAIIREHYGKTSAKTYFEGCSNGGREALIEAQRWPEDFDGIIARAPAYDFVELMLTFGHHAQRLAQPGAMPSGAKLARLGKAILAACDASDGLADGILSRTDACSFDPAVLQCHGESTPECLTPLELASVKALASPYVLKGRTFNAGWTPGDASDPGGWAPWLDQPELTATTGSRLSRDVIRFFITQDPKFDPATFDAAAWQPRIDAMSARVSARSADLGRFRARGGKLILWHGGADGIISQRGTTAYYEQLVQAAGGQAAADAFVEYFPAPGVQHCGGGAGADSVDLLPALEDWVEGGKPPSQANLVATRRAAADPRALSRPLCKYPLYPRYNGTGDVTRAASFTCVAPTPLTPPT